MPAEYICQTMCPERAFIQRKKVYSGGPCAGLVVWSLGTVPDESRTDFDTSAVDGGLKNRSSNSATLVAIRAVFSDLGRCVCVTTSGSQ